VTYASKISAQKLRNLKDFMKRSPKISFGVFCYTGPFSFDEENRILFLPAWMI
jgi:hypothetical protein